MGKNDFVNSASVYDRVKTNYIRCGVKFSETIYGTTRELKTPSKTIHMCGKFAAGVHLIRAVKVDVAKRVKDGTYVMKSRGNEKISTVFYSPENIQKYAGTKIKAIDINSCYFDTAYNLGQFSEKIYEMGHKKAGEYKKARVMAIGSMGKKMFVTTWHGGKIIDKKPTRDELAGARVDVLKSVYEMAIDIAKNPMIRDGFLFFLTDCFFVTAEKQEIVERLLEEYGYKHKNKEIDLRPLTSTGRHTDIINWHDLQDKDDPSYHYFNQKNNHIDNQK